MWTLLWVHFLSLDEQMETRTTGLNELRLCLSDDTKSVSRIGGSAPRLDYTSNYLDRYRYLCPISHKHLPTVGDREVSVFVRAGFQVSDDDTQFPNIGIAVCCICQRNRFVVTADA